MENLEKSTFPFFLEKYGEKIIRKLEKAKYRWRLLYINIFNREFLYRNDMTYLELYEKLWEIQKDTSSYPCDIASRLVKLEKNIKKNKRGLIATNTFCMIFTKNFDNIREVYNRWSAGPIEKTKFLELNTSNIIKSLEEMATGRIVNDIVEKIPQEDIDKHIFYMENVLKRPKVFYYYIGYYAGFSSFSIQLLDENINKNLAATELKKHDFFKNLSIEEIKDAMGNKIDPDSEFTVTISNFSSKLGKYIEDCLISKMKELHHQN